jgi:predicted Fe-S protein YdhL (DUF1289 family)
MNRPLKLGLSLVVVSAANRNWHWAYRHKREKAEKDQVLAALMTLGLSPSERLAKFAFGCHVVFTLVGGNRLDDDNLARAYKHWRDAVAAWVGYDDGDREKITFAYEQRPKAKGERRGSEITLTPK